MLGIKISEKVMILANEKSKKEEAKRVRGAGPDF